MMRIPVRDPIGKYARFAYVIRVADVIHVALCRWEPRPILGDEIDTRVGAMHPNRRRQARNIDNDPDSAGLHLVHNLVEPFEIEFALGRLERIPGEVSHANDIEAGPLHDGDVPIDLFWRAIDRLIACAYK